MALSDFTIKALKPKAVGRYYVGDGQGLWLEVFPSGKMAWRYRYSLNGNPGKVALGKYPAISLKAARKQRDECAEMVAQGESPAAYKRRAKAYLPTTMKVYDFGERYFKEIVSRDVKNPSSIRRYLEKEIYPSFAQHALKDLTAADVQRLIYRKRDSGHPAAAGQLRNLLKRIFDYALANGLVSMNPALTVPMRFITRAKSRDRALSVSEVLLFVQGIYHSKIRRQFKLALHIILLTLVRKSELLNARWKDVDFESKEWTIPAEHSKTGKPHVVYLARQTVELFRELSDLASTSELVLPSRGSLTRPFAANALNKALEGIRFDMEPFTIHDLRRTGATHLHEQGFPPEVVEKALNHTISGVRGIYNRAQYSEQRRLMLQHWADYVAGLTGVRKALVEVVPGDHLVLWRAGLVDNDGMERQVPTHHSLAPTFRARDPETKLPSGDAITSRIVRLPAVKFRTGLSRSTIYAQMAEGRFPRQVSLGARAVGWHQIEVDAWIALCGAFDRTDRKGWRG